MTKLALAIVDCASEKDRADFIEKRDKGLKKLEETKKDQLDLFQVAEIHGSFDEYIKDLFNNEEIQDYFALRKLIESKYNETFDKKLAHYTVPEDGSWEVASLFTPEELLAQYSKENWDNYPDIICVLENNKRTWYECKDHEIRWATEDEKEDRNKYEDEKEAWQKRIRDFLKSHEKVGIVMSVWFKY